jgi:hypothetical protein
MEDIKASKAVGTVALLIIVSCIYALVISVTLDDSIFNSITVTGTVTDETLTAVDNVTNSTLAAKVTYTGASCSLTTLNNITDGAEIVGAGNYTFYSTDCNVIFQDDSPFIGEDVNATYDYSYVSNNTLSGVNVTELKNNYGAFITAILSFIVIGGTIIGIMWFLKYVKPVLSKKEGINGLTA